MRQKRSTRRATKRSKRSRVRGGSNVGRTASAPQFSALEPEEVFTQSSKTPSKEATAALMHGMKEEVRTALSPLMVYIQEYNAKMDILQEQINKLQKQVEDNSEFIQKDKFEGARPGFSFMEEGPQGMGYYNNRKVTEEMAKAELMHSF